MFSNRWGTKSESSAPASRCLVLMTDSFRTSPSPAKVQKGRRAGSFTPSPFKERGKMKKEGYRPLKLPFRCESKLGSHDGFERSLYVSILFQTVLARQRLLKRLYLVVE